VRLFVEKTHKEDPDERYVSWRLLRALGKMRQVFA